jgi:trimethylamine--corrinoid protein Co-methyltransferase
MVGGKRQLRQQDLCPLRSDFVVGFHTSVTLERIRDAALTVLERTGVRFASAKARAVFAEHGAQVDDGSGIVHLRPELVLEALATAPREFVLASRDGAHDLDLSLPQTYCGPDGCGTEVVDWRTGERRPSTKADLAAITRMQDYLGSIQFWWPTVGAGDCGVTAPLHELDAALRNTGKHVQPMVNGERQARYAVEMGIAAAGGAAQLRSRPLMSDLVTVVSPLTHDRAGSEAALVFAEAGVPVCFATTPGLGTTAPATSAGAYVLGLAEAMSAAALVQLAQPGAPVLCSITRLHSDPRTGASLASPLDDRSLFLATELLHFVGIPAAGSYAGTDAVEPGTWQAAAENLASLMVATLDGCEIMNGIGLTNAYRLFTPEGLMLADDLYHRARHAFLDVAVDDEALAIDVIDSVGPGGHFLAQPHTRRHMREAVLRSLAQVAAPGGGMCDPVEVARERALDILERYQPQPLDPAIAARLDDVISAADAELVG